MADNSSNLLQKILKVETKDIFVDLKQNRNGVYLKISERSKGNRNTVLMPASGLVKLRDAIDEAISVAPSLTSGASAAADDAEDIDNSENSVVFVMGLPWETDEAELLSHMRKAGEVVKVEVLKSRGGRSLGRGVVEYANAAIAVYAINTLNQTEIGGRAISIRYNRQKRGGGGGGGRGESSNETGEKVVDEHRVFVSNLPWDTTSSDLTKFFESVGLVAESDVLSRRNGRSLGSGFVQFVDSRSVSAAIVQLNGAELGGRSIIVREYFQ